MISETAQDKLNNARAREWNHTISPRLAALHSWFLADEWQKGIGAYLCYMLEEKRLMLEGVSTPDTSLDFIRGQIFMLREFLALPAVIDRQIEMIEKNLDAGPKGDAGY